ncbi:MAG: recombinase family protein [Lachnospiraceae bacterium]
MVDEYASQIVKRIFKEYLSGKSMYKIAETLNQEGIATLVVCIAMKEENESQLTKYREKNPLCSNAAVGRIIGNEQYTGAMVYNRFKSKNVSDKHA